MATMLKPMAPVQAIAKNPIIRVDTVLGVMGTQEGTAPTESSIGTVGGVVEAPATKCMLDRLLAVKGRLGSHDCASGERKGEKDCLAFCASVSDNRARVDDVGVVCW